MSSVIAFTVDGTAKPTAVSASNPLPVTASGGGTGGAMKVEGVNASGGAASNPILIGYNQSGTVVQVNGESGAMAVGGNVASGATDSGNPVKIGGRYNATLPTFSNGQRGDLQITSRGQLLVSALNNSAAIDGSPNNFGGGLFDASGTARAVFTAPYVYNGSTWDRQRGSAGEGTITKPYAFSASEFQYSQLLSAAATTTIKAAAGAGVRNFITGLSWSSAAATVETVVTIQSGVTTIFQFDVPAGAAHGSITFPTPLKSAANTALDVTLSAAGPIRLNIQGYEAPA